MTGARGDGLAVVRRRARRLGVPLTEVDAGADPRLGPRRARGRPAAARAGPGSACAGGTRRPTSPSPTRSSTRSRRPGIATVPADGPAARLRDARSGPAGSSCSRVGGRDVLLDGAHNPAGAAALAVALDDLRPFLAPRADHARDGVDGRQGRRRASIARAGGVGRRSRARRSSRTSLDVPRALPAAELAARWRAAARRARPVDRAPTRTRRARPRRWPAGPGRSSSPVRSILSERCAATLVDDPDAARPGPDEAA